VPSWILKNEENFFSFLAGYADCEGSWSIIREGQNSFSSQFTISSEDKLILNQLVSKLRQLGIKAHLYLSRKKGDKTNFGKYSRDLYSLTIYRKVDIAKLIMKLQPICHHSEKIERMKRVLEKIVKRKE
jgi:cyclophilin family peptidyl-prolyl cis-trans isomerase